MYVLLTYWQFMKHNILSLSPCRYEFITIYMHDVGANLPSNPPKISHTPQPPYTNYSSYAFPPRGKCEYNLWHYDLSLNHWINWTRGASAVHSTGHLRPFQIHCHDTAWQTLPLPFCRLNSINSARWSINDCQLAWTEFEQYFCCNQNTQTAQWITSGEYQFLIILQQLEIWGRARNTDQWFHQSWINKGFYR